MAIPNWICLECKKEFKPTIKDDGSSFNCPACGSPKTIAYRHDEIMSEVILRDNSMNK